MQYAPPTDDKGNWYDLVRSDVFGMIEAYSFDYEYLIDKFDLIERRNNGEFDQVWIYSIDPAQTFETTMVGSKPYWINGTPIEKDCDNFVLANVSISRRDANLHALGHGVEGIMSMAFNGTHFSYNKSYDDATEEEYQKLNLWQKFSMADYESKGQNAGVGNVHYPFNGVNDYDYTNTNKVYTNWKNWLNYPNLTGEKELHDSSAFLQWEGNESISGDQNRDSDRLYMRFWFYLFPHVEGVTEDGYSNNWWTYFCTLDCIDAVKCLIDSKTYTEVDEITDLTFKTISYFEKEKTITLADSNIVSFKVDNENVIEYDPTGKVLIKGEGKAKLFCYADGKFAAYDIEVVKSDVENKYNVSVEKHKYVRKIEMKTTPLVKLSGGNIEVIINAEKPLIEYVLTYDDETTETISILSNKIDVNVTDESILSINDDGTLELKNLGQTNVTCIADGTEKTYLVKVQTTACILSYDKNSITNASSLPYSIYANANGELIDVPTPVHSNPCMEFDNWYYDEHVIDEYVFTQNYVFITAKFIENHNYTSEVKREATCTKEGTVRLTCQNEGCLTKIKTEKLPMLPHELEHTPEKPATCKEEGMKEYWTCTVCTKLFSDNAGKTEIESGEKIDFAEHKLENTPEKPATCKEEGMKEYWTCTVCSKLFNDEKGKTEIESGEKIELAEHKTENIPEKAATCKEEGMKEYWTCTVCKKLFSDKESKNEITSGEKIEINTEAHDWNEWVTTKEPTTYSTGLKVRTCKNDETHTQSEEIPKKESTNNGGGGGGSSSVTKYEIKVIKSGDGTVSPDTIKVRKNSDITFEIKANEGNEIVNVIIDGKSVGTVSKYTFEKVAQEHTVEVHFKAIDFSGDVSGDANEEIIDNTWDNPFDDVKEDDWYYESVKFANENKLFNGMSDTEFGANINMTRGMLVTVLYRLAGEPATNKSIPFSDVDMSKYYANAISWAKQNNIVNGIDDTTFAPDAQISREQLVTILYRYAKLQEKDIILEETTNILSYEDVNQVSEYAIPALQWACGDGIITGRTNSTLVPKGNATRAEVATMLMRFVDSGTSIKSLK